jgi:FKBP-type peptidyl-prolyl cis-trans isomerase FkpA
MKQLLFAAFVSTALLASCQQSFKKTPSGMPYKLFKGNAKGPLAQPGQIAKFQLVLKLKQGSKDSVLVNTYEQMPGYQPVDTSQRSKYTYMEILRQCAAGDSLIFTMSIDSLKKRGMLPPEDNTVFKKGGLINGNLKLLKLFSNEQDAQADYQKEMQLAMAREQKQDEVRKVQEVKDLQAYLDKKGIKAVKTKNGAFVEITEPGTGTKADSGTSATVMYRGMLQNGEVFDTNMDTSKHHTDPFTFTVGQGQVIKGWDEGLPYFGIGGKGKIYIPSTLGYGRRGSPPVIPPSSNLVFEIEVKDVKAVAEPKSVPAVPAPQH